MNFNENNLPLKLNKAFWNSLVDAGKQSDHFFDGSPFQHWNHFKGNTKKTSERRGAAHMGFPKHLGTILN